LPPGTHRDLIFNSISENLRLEAGLLIHSPLGQGQVTV
jgi:hypothetical protein